MLLIEYFTISYVSSIRDLQARQQISALFKAEFDLYPFSVTFFLRPFSRSSFSPGSTVCKFKARDSKELLNYIGAVGSGGPQIARIPKCWRSKKDELLQCVPVDNSVISRPERAVLVQEGETQLVQGTKREQGQE